VFEEFPYCPVISSTISCFIQDLSHKKEVQEPRCIWDTPQTSKVDRDVGRIYLKLSCHVALLMTDDFPAALY